MSDETFDPYAALGISQDASQELIEIAFSLMEKRYTALERNKRTTSITEQYRDAKRAYEMLTNPNMALPGKYTRIAQPRQQFVMKVATSRTQLPLIEEPQVLYARLDFQPMEMIQSTAERSASHLNLTLVLDRSNSMHGTRLDRVKAAAFQIIDNLTPGDVLSVVAFSDRAAVLIPATKVKDKPALKAQVTMMAAFGGTEIYHGLNEGIKQNREFFDPKYVNHIILLTDGNTYGDEEQCLQLATNASVEGIGISAMGLGTDWNDDFLDTLASRTGGTSQFIRNVSEVAMFINNHVRHLSSTFAERMRLQIELAEGVTIDQMFKIAPLPQPIEINENEIRLGVLEARRPTTVLIQFRITARQEEGIFNVARLIGMGDILVNEQPAYFVLHDVITEITALPFDDETNTQILDALSRLALYRMQEQANDSIKRGDFEAATSRLERLATRLLAMGQGALATQVLNEASVVKTTHMLSAEGKKTIKYNTRILINTELKNN
jgi:Ca-activated chloride channel homolog